MKRLFLAIPISEDLKSSVEKELKTTELHPKFKDAKWTNPQDWHITTHFLGECPEHLIPELIEFSRGASGRMGSFDLKPRDLTLFPYRGQARMIWLSFDRSLDFETLVSAQIELLSPFLKDREDEQTQIPHLTLARLKTPVSNHRFHRNLNNFPTLEVKEICMFESVLTPEGPIYTCLERFPLKDRQS